MTQKRKSVVMNTAEHERLTNAAKQDGFSTEKGRGGQTVPFLMRLLDLRELARQRDWRKLWALVDNEETQ